MLLIDDALLLRVVAQTADAELTDAADGSQLFTTGCWYYRLARAVRQSEWTGALSSAVALLPEAPRRRALAALDHLPDRIGLLDFRAVVPTMAALNVGRQLNLLAAEAPAAALLLDAEVLVATDGLSSARSRRLPPSAARPGKRDTAWDGFGA